VILKKSEKRHSFIEIGFAVTLQADALEKSKKCDLEKSAKLTLFQDPSRPNFDDLASLPL
jgi:hypothetical protein